MPYKEPFLNPDSTPTKKDLEDFLGVSRYRRFEAIYDELREMDLDARMVWNDLDKNWSLRIYKGKTPIFSIRWGIDYFYAYLVLKTEDYQRIARHKNITSDALELLQKHPPIPTQRTTPIEANLEMMREQEGFFELLPVLIKVLA